MPSLRSSLLLLVLLTGICVPAACSGGLFPKPSSSASASNASAAPTPSPTPTADPLQTGSLKSDWIVASRAAGTWATDAVPYEIEGQNIGDDGVRDTTNSMSTWIYRFAAPSRPGQLMTVGVTGTDQVISQVIAGSAPYPTFRLSAVGLDSPRAFSKAEFTGSTGVRVNVLNDTRFGVVVYLFPDKQRLRVDAFTGAKLNQ